MIPICLNRKAKNSFVLMYIRMVFFGKAETSSHGSQACKHKLGAVRFASDKYLAIAVQHVSQGLLSNFFPDLLYAFAEVEIDFRLNART